MARSRIEVALLERFPKGARNIATVWTRHTWTVGSSSPGTDALVGEKHTSDFCLTTLILGAERDVLVVTLGGGDEAEFSRAQFDLVAVSSPSRKLAPPVRAFRVMGKRSRQVDPGAGSVATGHQVPDVPPAPAPDHVCDLRGEVAVFDGFAYFAAVDSAVGCGESALACTAMGLDAVVVTRSAPRRGAATDSEERSLATRGSS